MKRKRISKILLSIKLIGFIFLLTSCSKPGNNKIYFSQTPVNLGSKINSIYDDYNSTAPPGETAPLCFSSSRNSNGANFDIIYKLLSIDYFNNEVQIDTVSSVTTYMYVVNKNLYQACDIINSSYNEMGPYLIPIGSNQANNGSTRSYILLFSSNSNGHQHIRYIHNIGLSEYTEPQNIIYLNSDSDDMYPALSNHRSFIYFCSNRTGDFDIYKAQLLSSVNLLESIQDTSEKSIVKETTLSINGYDDKCPFIIENFMVFASNRPGGYGGFDLYYSYYTNGSWTTPVNFGSKINSANDEYRPIVKEINGFSNHFMIFSSNRPGGFGGFDLYYVGIDNQINWNENTE